METNEKRKSPKTTEGLGVLLEDIAGQVSAVAEGVLANSEQIGQLTETTRKGFDRIENRLTRVETEIRALREMMGTPEAPKIITREEYLKLDERLRKIEERLKLTPA